MLLTLGKEGMEGIAEPLISRRGDLVEAVVGDGFYGGMFVVDVHVEGREQGVGIAVLAVCLDGRADARLCEDEVCELVSIE
jgi:hypothetical protein